MNDGLQKPTSYYPDPLNVTLFGKRIFADTIKDLQMKSSCMTRGGPKSNDRCPYKRQRGGGRGGGHRDGGKKWSDVAKEAARAKERSSPRAPEGAPPCRHQDFIPPASLTVREYISDLVSLWPSSRHALETNTGPNAPRPLQLTPTQSHLPTVMTPRSAVSLRPKTPVRGCQQAPVHTITTRTPADNLL